MPNMRGWSLYCIESYHLAEHAYAYGYGLACYIMPRIVNPVTEDSHAGYCVLVTPGMFSNENDPNTFSQERMTRKQIREYRDLSEKVYNLNMSW